MKYPIRQLAIFAGSIIVACLFVSRGTRAEEMQYPVASAVAQDGTIFVADIDTPAIWKIKDGKIEKYFEASKKFRTPLNRPRSLAIDQDGKLLAGDSATREVYRFDDAGKPVPLTKGSIGIPRSIAVLSSGELMVSDQELHCIWKVPAAGGDPVKLVNVPGIIALCVDKDGGLWATSGLKNALLRVGPDGKIENVITESPIRFPQDVAVDDAKTTYVADNYSKAIWKVVSGQAPVKLVEGDPLVSPVGITRFGDRLIVTDPHAKAIFQIDAAGKLTKLAPLVSTELFTKEMGRPFVKFIHAADLHIDSPLRGLEAYDGAPLEQLRGATRLAFQNLIRLAIEQAVDFVVIAGDLFDGKWQDMRTGLWTAAQLRELDRQGIPVFLLQGNHDAASKVPHAIRWPANVRVFSVDKPETIVLEDLHVALHGQGFAREKTTSDLAAQYPPRVDGCFNIGVLHTSLTGSPDHDTYAPTSVATLVGRRYDYWALGHIHARSDPPIWQEPFVAFCGNLQGRHIHETGAKGCLLLTVEENMLSGVEFVAADTVRWQLVDIELQRADGRTEMFSAIEQGLSTARETAEGRLVAVRLILRGACEVHREIARETTRAALVAEIRNLANDLADDIWMEKIVFETRAPVDVQTLRQAADLLGELLRSLHHAGESEETLRGLAEHLRPLRDKAAQELSEAELDLEDPGLLARWLQQAETMLVARLTEFDG